MLNIDEVNSLCQDIAEVTLENMVDDYYDQLGTGNHGQLHPGPRF